MKPAVKREFTAISVNTGGENERMCWLPIDSIDEYDVRPVTAKRLVQDIPKHFVTIVNDRREL